LAALRPEDFARVAGFAFERAAGLALARDAGLLAAREVVALDRELVVFAREVVDFARVVARGLDAVRRAAGADPISYTGTSSWTTSSASWSIMPPRKSAILFSSRPMSRASLAVSLSPTALASASIKR
jgi:hypothetical protein